MTNNRMSLAHVRKGKIDHAIRLVMYGQEGVGKSWFAACSRKPIFLGAENGTENYDVHRLPQPGNWSDVIDGVRMLTRETHDYGSLVLDTLDWAEPLCWEYVCSQGGQKSIEDFGYGKGYLAALEQWRVLLSALDDLRQTKNMDIILISHSDIKTFKNPTGDDYDRYSMKINHRAAGLIREWSDVVLFAAWETYATKVGPGKDARSKGFSTGKRVAYTERRAGWDAKNRYGLPEVMPLDWTEFYTRVKFDEAKESLRLREEIKAKLSKLRNKDRRTDGEKWLSKPGLSVEDLRVGLNTVEVELAEVET